MNIKKILIGGSPCTAWSIARSKNRETKPEGIGWELFKNYLIAKEKFQPDYFLYENNKSAAQPIKDQISEELGVPLQFINSALVSAQNRQRFYAHNIPGVSQPEDRGILLKDILDSGISFRNEKAYCIDANYHKGGCLTSFNSQSGRRIMVAEPVQVLNINPSGKGMNGAVIHTNWKSRCLTTNKGEGQKIIEPIRIGTFPNVDGEIKNSQGYRIYSTDGKSVTLCVKGGGIGAKTGLYAIPWDSKTYPVYEVKNGLIDIKDKQYPIKLPDGYYIIRKLTVTECCRLQTLPDNYCKAVSNSQAYKGLGNGWTAEVIIHILNHMNIPLDEEIQVLSMYDGIGTGRYCFDKMGYKNIKYYAYEIDKYAMTVANDNYPDIIQCGDAFQVRDDSWNFAELISA